MNAAEKFFADSRAAFDREKTKVAKCWFALKQPVRRAICNEAELPMSLARPELPLGDGDREKLREAISRLEYNHKFTNCMDYKDWRDALIPPPEEKTEGGETGPADELAQKRSVLQEALSMNSGQKKTPVTGGANA
ncbi:hypothetical protein [Aeromonas enteropelogenes]|uniref:hypothetical protein n=1 Tax=Aeromonas enteropelogenes TaxID=29489 RepID=UPI003BA2FF37